MRTRVMREDGISMIAAMMALVTGMLLAAAAWATANSGIHLADGDRWSRLAYQRAQSGVSDYVKRLANDPNYWSACDRGGIGTTNGLGTSAINDTIYGSAYDAAYGTTNGHPTRRWLPYDATAGSATDRGYNGQYTIDLLPANGNTMCGTTSQATAATRMINSLTGTFRVRVTGRAGPPVPSTVAASGIESWRAAHWKKVSIVTEFRRAGFLDYVYFTDHEAMDPNLINAGQQSFLSWIYSFFSPPGDTVSKCNDYYRRALDGSTPGREALESGGWVCENDRPIYNGEQIKGPFHTNDSSLVESTSGSSAPLFGNANMGDRVEIYDSGQTGNACSSGNHNGGCACPFRTSKKAFDTNISTGRTCSNTARMNTGVQLVTGPDAGYIDMPSGNSELKIWAGLAAPNGSLYRGKTTITLRSDGKYDVVNPYVTATGVAYPSSGVIYVQNDGSPSCDSNPDADYNSASLPGGMSPGCALVEVKGTYNQSLTIGSEADIVVTGNIQRSSGTSALLGMVANNYVRVRHYPKSSGDQTNYMKKCTYQFTNLLDLFGLWGLSDFGSCLHVGFSLGNAFNLLAQAFSGGVGYTCERESSPVYGTPVTNIQAAVLALRHSFTVDGSQCGDQVGDSSGSATAANTLVFSGAMTQNWRGALTDQDWSAVFDPTCNWINDNSGSFFGIILGGIFSYLGWCGNHHGYRFKDVSYDYLLRALSPPHFLTPTESAWKINRMRQTAPACGCGPTN